MSGKIRDALDTLSAHYPELCNNNKSIKFSLLSIQFINYIKSNQITEALKLSDEEFIGNTT